MKHEPIDLFGNLKVDVAARPGQPAYFLFEDWPEAILEVRYADGIHVLGADYGGNEWWVRGTCWRSFHGGPRVLRETYHLAEEDDSHVAAAA
jgi:hypothetical protein